MFTVTSYNCSAIFVTTTIFNFISYYLSIWQMDVNRHFQQLFNHYLATTINSKTCSTICNNDRHLQYHTLPFGLVYGYLSSLPTLVELFLVVAAIFISSHYLSTSFMNLCRHFQQLFNYFLWGRPSSIAHSIFRFGLWMFT